MVDALRATIVLVLLAAASARADTPVRVPPGTRADAQGQLVSGRGLRDTSDFLAAELARRGIAVQQIGPYGVRSVELTRFLSQTPSTPWLAIHVLRIGGKTLIFFVPRTKQATALDEPPPAVYLKTLGITRGSSNGRTSDSGSGYHGSNPCPRTREGLTASALPGRTTSPSSAP